MSEAQPQAWLTIVTVVKDDPEGFLRTLASVTMQELSGVEWLVIDGSTDPHALPALLARAGSPPCVYLWSPPRGVYSAMNEGLARATGTYVYFLNAGDELSEPGSLQRIRSLIDDTSPQWLFGQVSFVDSRGRTVLPPRLDYGKEKAAAFARGRFPPHQGTVARTDLLRRLGGFDTRYRIAADYALLLRLSQASEPAQTEAVIATFYEGGLSSVEWKQSLDEFHAARIEILPMTTWGRVAEALQATRQRAAMSLGRRLRR